MLKRATFSRRHGSDDHHLRAFSKREDLVNDILRRVFRHFLTADRRISAAYARIEQSQIFIDLRGRAECGARIARRHLLLNGDSRWKTLDIVALGFLHTAEKLTGIRREALHIAALAFGIKRVEG